MIYGDTRMIFCNDEFNKYNNIKKYIKKIYKINGFYKVSLHINLNNTNLS